MVFTIGAIVLGVVSIIICLVISLQQAKSSGLGAGLAGGSDTYWSRNKGKTKEGRLVRVTVIAAIVFFVLAIVLNIGPIANPTEASAADGTEAVVEEVADDVEDEIGSIADEAVSEVEEAVADEGSGTVTEADTIAN